MSRRDTVSLDEVTLPCFGKPLISVQGYPGESPICATHIPSLVLFSSGVALREFRLMSPNIRFAFVNT